MEIPQGTDNAAQAREGLRQQIANMDDAARVNFLTDMYAGQAQLHQEVVNLMDAHHVLLRVLSAFGYIKQEDLNKFYGQLMAERERAEQAKHADASVPPPDGIETAEGKLPLENPLPDVPAEIEPAVIEKVVAAAEADAAMEEPPVIDPA